MLGNYNQTKNNPNSANYPAKQLKQLWGWILAIIVVAGILVILASYLAS